jgi:hypothetical protein
LECDHHEDSAAGSQQWDQRSVGTGECEVNNYYKVCEICGAAGHKGKGCPLYRLNEKQEAVSGGQKPPVQSAKSS